MKKILCYLLVVATASAQKGSDATKNKNDKDQQDTRLIPGLLGGLSQGVSNHFNQGRPFIPGQQRPIQTLPVQSGQGFPGQQGQIFPSAPGRPVIPGQHRPIQTLPVQSGHGFPGQPLQIFPQAPGSFPGQIQGQVPGQFPVLPGQISGQLPVQIPGQFPIQIPGQFPVQIPGQFPVQIPGQRPVIPGQNPLVPARPSSVVPGEVPGTVGIVQGVVEIPVHPPVGQIQKCPNRWTYCNVPFRLTDCCKPGLCPKVRLSCPPVKNFQRPPMCQVDRQCGGTLKCCEDACLPYKTCKSTIY